MSYKPVEKHWFYKISDENWVPFSNKDSAAIQQSYEGNGPEIISTDSGRYDVNVKEKTRTPVYWKNDKSEIRNCSWFYKSFNKNHLPYDETIADKLEEGYKNALINNKWNIQIIISNDEIVFMQTPNKILHFLNSQDVTQYFWNETRSRIVTRGLDKFKIDSGDDSNCKIDHLIFVVHGITSGVLLKFRSDTEVVEQLRDISNKLIKSHYKNSFDQGQVGRIEVLPISWQNLIHSPDTKIDEKLKTITLESLPKFRYMANNTVLDVLSYTSPFHCQNIINAVGKSINENYMKFCKRNPNFRGKVSLLGHSLGGLILFDLLTNQKNKIQVDTAQTPDNSSSVKGSTFNESVTDRDNLNVKRVALPGTGQPIFNYPELLFEPHMCFALGSPIGLFVALRDTDNLGVDFKLPTCSGFYNIFHPYDPVAYRMEGLVNPQLGALRPVVIPYHKGGKRKHLEIKETMIRVKNELKEKVYVTYKNIFDKIALPSKSEKETNEEIKKEVDEILQLQISDDSNMDESLSLKSKSEELAINYLTDVQMGKLNNSKRIDYVLQERPYEVINEYLFALNSHCGYWESEDTMLFILNEMYSSLDILPEMPKS